MSKMSDHYPVGMDGCTREGLNGNCGEKCPLLENEERIRFRDECYTPSEYWALKRKVEMASIKYLEVNDEI